MIQFDSIFFKWVAQPPARFLSDPFMEREFRFLGIPNFEGQKNAPISKPSILKRSFLESWLVDRDSYSDFFVINAHIIG